MSLEAGVRQSTKTVWEHRNGKNYYALNEKITSIMYLTKALLAKNISVEGIRFLSSLHWYSHSLVAKSKQPGH